MSNERSFRDVDYVNFLQREILKYKQALKEVKQILEACNVK